MAILSIFFLKSIISLLGAKGQIAKESIAYGRILLLALPFYVLQDEFQCLFATAGKPKLGLLITVMAGLTNIALDALFVAVFRWGIEGAAIATVASQVVGGVIPLCYFVRKNSSYLQLGSCHLNVHALFKTCTNGASELMGNISSSVVSLLFNLKLMQYVGEDGVAAYGVLMYVSMIFQAIFMGYSMGVAPVVGYHHGARSYKELKSLRKKSLLLISLFSIVAFLIGRLLAQPLSMIFFSYDPELLKLTVRAFSIFSISFLLSGIGIFGSAFFTALNDGFTSALLSFLRIFVFQCAAVLVLPVFWKLDGIWSAVVIAEILSVIMTGLLFVTKQKKFQY